jgi:hypothetical protein
LLAFGSRVIRSAFEINWKGICGMTPSEQDRKEPGAANVKELIGEFSLEHFLGKSIGVLCGTREPDFAYEKQLRLFQFKAWLLTAGSDAIIVRTAGMTYAAAMIARRMGWLRKKYPEDKQSSLLIRALRNSGYRSLYDSTFVSPRTVYNLTDGPSFAVLWKNVNKKQKHIRNLNELTFWRLRIAATEELSCALSNAYNAYDAVRAYEAEENLQRGIKLDPKDRKYSSATVKTTHEGRESREPFLFTSFRYTQEITELSSNVVDMLKLLDKQVKDSKLFRDYFGRCQTVVSLLDIKSLSAGTLKSWSGVNRIQLDDILPISEEDQNWLGVKDEERRSVEETAKSVRQRPSSRLS